MDQSEACELVKKYGTNDPLEIVKQLRIIVLYEELGNIYGYFNESRRVPIIHVNFKLNEIWLRWVIGHELGHRILHPGMNMPFLRRNTLFSVDRFEREANCFVLQLLTSGNKPEMGESRSTYLHRCGVPEEFHFLY